MRTARDRGGLHVLRGVLRDARDAFDGVGLGRRCERRERARDLEDVRIPAFGILLEATLNDEIQYRVCGAFDPDAIANSYGIYR